MPPVTPTPLGALKGRSGVRAERLLQLLDLLPRWLPLPTPLNPPLRPALIPYAVGPHTVERAWFMASRWERSAAGA